MRIEVKSLVIGMLLAVCAALVIGAAAESGSVSLPAPRYQISAWGQFDDRVHGVFIVNSETGELFSVLGYADVTFAYGPDRFERLNWQYSNIRYLGRPRPAK